MLLQSREAKRRTCDLKKCNRAEKIRKDKTRTQPVKLLTPARSKTLCFEPKPRGKHTVKAWCFELQAKYTCKVAMTCGVQESESSLDKDVQPCLISRFMTKHCRCLPVVFVLFQSVGSAFTCWARSKEDQLIYHFRWTLL